MNPITIKDIESCLNNAKRLFNDSLKTSKPTQAALLELSIEEIAKGCMLYLQYMKEFGMRPREELQSTKSRVFDRLSPSQMELIGKMATVMKDFVNDLEVIEAFQGHKIKLEYLTRLIEYL